MTTTTETFGDRLRRLRGELSQNELAYRARNRLPEGWVITSQQLSNYELGKTSESSADTVVLIAIADALDLPLEDLSPVHAKRRDHLADLLKAHSR